MSILVASDIKGHNPLPDEVYIAKSQIHGHGIFVNVALPNGYDFGITHVADKRFANGFMRTPFSGFINHSLVPNCQIYEVADTLHIKTIKPINKNEELTIDYQPWYSDAEVASYR
jgi:hypothetical protein